MGGWGDGPILCVPARRAKPGGRARPFLLDLLKTAQFLTAMLWRSHHNAILTNLSISDIVLDFILAVRSTPGMLVAAASGRFDGCSSFRCLSLTRKPCNKPSTTHSRVSGEKSKRPEIFREHSSQQFAAAVCGPCRADSPGLEWCSSSVESSRLGRSSWICLVRSSQLADLLQMDRICRGQRNRPGSGRRYQRCQDYSRMV